jgi:phenylalanyl-tRNA synthetase beta chain
MKVLNTWLQNHIKEKLPEAEKLADMFTFHAFEVEGVENYEGYFVMDVKILPDRAHYALSHKGIAREIAAIGGLSLKEHNWQNIPATVEEKVSVTIEEPTLVRRYMARLVKNITVTNSPDWFGLSLQAIGQRQINNVVDASNVVMFDIGQPMHAFDADKVVGGITVRKAKQGEKITTLDTKEVTLDDWMLVIADDVGPLAIAGVKGGNRAAVTEATKNIIIESANFEPAQVRKTSTKIGIRNDSSKRFENDLSPVTAEQGMAQICGILKDFNPHAQFGEIVDVYTEPVKPWTVTVTAEYISELLGVSLSEEKIIEILRKLEITVTKNNEALVLEIPYWRLDLVIPQDIAEEVGRIYGYDKIEAAPLPAVEKTSINKIFYWSEKIKDLLIEEGYSEVFTYSLRNTGDVEIQNPLAQDKGFLRSNLYEGVEQALTFNARNAPLLGQEEIKVFEIGTVFTAEGESLHLAFGYFSTKSIKNKEKVALETVEKLVKTLGEKLGVELKGLIESSEAGVVFEEDLTALIEKLPEPEVWDIKTTTGTTPFKPYSAYPFATRDIAVFTPEGTKDMEPLSIIIKEAGELLVREYMFDVFTKAFPDGAKKTSYAFRLVFQSFERTLTDSDINPIMQRITDVMNSKEGWQVR